MRHALFNLRDLFIGLKAMRHDSLATAFLPEGDTIPRVSVIRTTVLVDWDRPEADELRPDAEAMSTPETEG